MTDTSPASSPVRENLSYEAFGRAVRELAQTIADDGYQPDVILSTARGGVFVAGGLAYALDCKNIHLVNVEFYTGVGTTLDMPVMLAPVPDVVDFSEKKVLITGEVADTGKTLKLVHDFCLDQARPRLLPRRRRRGAVRRRLREVAVAGEVRVRVEADR